MADSSKTKFSPEILANADNIQFAEELVGYVMLRNSTNYVLNRSPVPLREFIHAFDQIAQRAVQCIETYIEKKINDTFHQMQQDRNFLSSSAYSSFVYRTALKSFSKDFDANAFLVFCVGISKMAALFYNSGILDAPDLAIIKLIDILEIYDLREGGWDALRSIAKSYDTILRVSEPTPQRIQSGKIEGSNMFANGHESANSSLSGGHDVLKENEENNLGQKQDRAFSQKDIFLKSIALEIEGNKLIDKSATKSDFISKSDCFRKSDLSLNAKDHESPETLSAGLDKLIESFSSTDEFHMETSDTCQTSIFTITKESKANLALPSDEKIDTNNPSMILNENISVKSSEPTKKPSDSNQICASYKRKLDFSLHKENSANIEEDMLFDSLFSTNEIGMETSDTSQTSIFNITKESKRNLDLPSDEKNDTNNLSMILDENISVNNSEPTDKAPNSKRMCISYKRKLDFSLHKENNANGEYVPETD